ncbi:hypothetical protein CIK84_09570 [Glutamicibacter arilaitensis]|uniref:Uncharacterized protein n=1 Tax=Glutamicibacter arilaitensis TaxID=256701 RepID=A0A2N7S6I8_9MICC|nr:hypothetical protein CIK84_09570 [Glutamicibacter arilaitensis]
MFKVDQPSVAKSYIHVMTGVHFGAAPLISNHLAAIPISVATPPGLLDKQGQDTMPRLVGRQLLYSSELRSCQQHNGRLSAGALATLASALVFAHPAN